MAAEEVLHIVLGRYQEHVQARIVHHPVEPIGIERRYMLSFTDVEHWAIS
jgi:hypothetical protein